MASMYVQGAVASDEKVAAQQQNLGCTMVNQTQSKMTIGRTYQCPPSIPDTIEPKRSVDFTDNKQPGSYCGVQYNVLTAPGVGTAWLLAWKLPSSPEPTKVYVTCGEYIKMMKIEWEEILLKVDAATAQSTANDIDSKTKAEADIKYVSSPPPGYTSVEAFFDVIS